MHTYINQRLPTFTNIYKLLTKYLFGTSFAIKGLTLQVNYSAGPEYNYL